MKNLISFFILINLSFLLGCSSSSSDSHTGSEDGDTIASSEPSISRDLEEIREDGKLKVLITYSATSYFLYRGQPLGYEYELLQRLAEHLDLELELVVSNDLDNFSEDLRSGKADIVAHGLAITSARKKQVAFSDYLYLTKQVLVQKKPDNWRKMSWASVQKTLVDDPIELIGDTVSVRKNSSYFERLQNLSQEIGGKIVIDTLDGSLSTDEIIKKVVDGEIEYTIADKNLASINASYYPILDIDVPVSFSQRIAWAMRPNSKELLAAVNDWVKAERKETAYYVIYNKYFRNKRNFRRRVKSDFYSLNNDQISKYDELIQKHAKRIGWDWRLVASLVYQESRFDPTAKSWAGAAGLMQMMPATAKALGVTNRSNVEQNLRGGTNYLDKLYNRFENVSDSTERIKLAMASYNCGYGHVRDAQRLAEKRGLDKNKWEENVGKMILELSYPRNYNKPFIKYGYVRGQEPYNYVDQIFKRYDHYTTFIES